MLSTTRELATRLLKGDRAALARAITLIESQRHDHNRQAQLMLNHVLSQKQTQAQAPNAPRDLRLGICGPPGAGKSTLIENLGMHIANSGEKLAVITIDPSSHRSGGSILGDKTRMAELSRHEHAFVRPSPSSGILGGVAQYTHDVIQLCQSAGYGTVIVETVGLGQSEILIDQAVDVVTLVIPPAGGDELQGVKKGIIEIADLLVVNKHDGDLIPAATRTAAEYRLAMQLQRRKVEGWKPPVTLVSALTNSGLEELWEGILECHESLRLSGVLQSRRNTQAERWMWEHLRSQVQGLVHADPSLKGIAEKQLVELKLERTSPRAAAAELLAAISPRFER